MVALQASLRQPKARRPPELLPRSSVDQARLIANKTMLPRALCGTHSARDRLVGTDRHQRHHASRVALPSHPPVAHFGKCIKRTEQSSKRIQHSVPRRALRTSSLNRISGAWLAHAPIQIICIFAISITMPATAHARKLAHYRSSRSAADAWMSAA